ncbi:hypothetical protein LTR08_007174 [Meristemomyces frigidus]|nr:hypothetical protein LTR08_007174 [Meristemomyces frigidus]
MARSLRSSTKPPATAPTTYAPLSPSPPPQQKRFPHRRTATKPKAAAKLPPKTHKQQSFTQDYSEWLGLAAEPSGDARVANSSGEEDEVEIIEARPAKRRRRTTSGRVGGQREMAQPTYTQAVRTASTRKAKRVRLDDDGFQMLPDGLMGGDGGTTPLEHVRKRMQERRVAGLQCTDWTDAGDEGMSGPQVANSSSQLGAEVADTSSQVDDADDHAATPRALPRTPGRLRFTGTIPSSQSPASVSMSTQRSLRFRDVGRSPLKEKSSNMRSPTKPPNPASSQKPKSQRAQWSPYRSPLTRSRDAHNPPSTLKRKLTVQDSQQYDAFPLLSSPHVPIPPPTRAELDLTLPANPKRKLRRVATVQDSQYDASQAPHHQPLPTQQKRKRNDETTPAKPKQTLKRATTVPDSQLEDLDSPPSPPPPSQHADTHTPTTAPRSPIQKPPPNLHRDLPPARNSTATLEPPQSNPFDPPSSSQHPRTANPVRSTRSFARVSTIQDSEGDDDEDELLSPGKKAGICDGVPTLVANAPLAHEEAAKPAREGPGEGVVCADDGEEYYHYGADDDDDGDGDDEDEDEEGYYCAFQETYDPADEALARDAARFGETQALEMGGVGGMRQGGGGGGGGGDGEDSDGGDSDVEGGGSSGFGFWDPRRLAVEAIDCGEGGGGGASLLDDNDDDNVVEDEEEDEDEGPLSFGFWDSRRMDAEQSVDRVKPSPPLLSSDDNDETETEDELHQGDDEIDFHADRSSPTNQLSEELSAAAEVEANMQVIRSSQPAKRRADDGTFIASQRREDVRVGLYEDTATTQSYRSPAKPSTHETSPTGSHRPALRHQDLSGGEERVPSSPPVFKLPNSHGALHGTEDVILIPSSPPAPRLSQASTQWTPPPRHSPPKPHHSSRTRTSPPAPSKLTQAPARQQPPTNPTPRQQTSPPSSPASAAPAIAGEASYPTTTLPSSPLPFEQYSAWHSYRPPAFLDTHAIAAGIGRSSDDDEGGREAMVMDLGSLGALEEFSLPGAPPEGSSL